jgi:hypothetical protein
LESILGLLKSLKILALESKALCPPFCSAGCERPVVHKWPASGLSVLDVYYIPDVAGGGDRNFSSGELPYSHPRSFRQYTFQAGSSRLSLNGHEIKQRKNEYYKNISLTKCE